MTIMMAVLALGFRLTAARSIYNLSLSAAVRSASADNTTESDYDTIDSDSAKIKAVDSILFETPHKRALQILSNPVVDGKVL